MKKKLLITTDCFLPRWDGIARFLKELMPFLTREFDVSVLCPKFPGTSPDFRGVHVHRYPLLKLRFGDIYFSHVRSTDVAAHVRAADIVFNQTLGPIGAASIAAARKHNTPLVSFAHSIDWELASRALKYGKFIVEVFVKLFARWKYNQCDLVLTPSVGVSDTLSAHGVRTRKIVVPLCVDTQRFRPATSKPMAKKAIGIAPQKLVIGFCGRIGREKDLPTLIHAFLRLQHKHDAVLLIVGAGIEEYESKNPRIVFSGAVDNVVPYLQAMDIFVMPSLTETSSLATMEAIACGIPVIATPVGSIPEYVEDGITGFLFARRDVDALAEKLNALLRSPKARETVGTAARKAIVQRGNWEQTAQKINHVLHELIQ
jgi:glycosyltransferase involved in cell wall biosynthesis